MAPRGGRSGTMTRTNRLGFDLPQYGFALLVITCSSEEEEHVMGLGSIVVLSLVISAFVIFALTLMYGDFQSGRRAKE